MQRTAFPSVGSLSLVVQYASPSLSSVSQEHKLDSDGFEFWNVNHNKAHVNTSEFDKLEIAKDKSC